MPDLSIYKVNLDTPQPDGRKGESPRVAFTKYNDLVSFLEENTGAAGSLISDLEPTETFAFMEWIDTSTTPAVIKRRNRDNTSWLTIGSYEKPLTDFVEKVADKGLSTNDYTNEDKQIVGGVTQALEQKVDKVVGKGLSTNDYSDEDKQIVGGVTQALEQKVDKVVGKGLSTNDYSDEDKQIVGGVTQALEQKVDKVVGKGLSTNDYSDEDKQIVGGVTQALEQKVDKVVGKGLSTNDYSDEDKALVSIISSQDLAWLSMPIGVPFPLFGELPPTNNAFRYVVLSDANPYNDGALINKEVSGTAPNLVIKYTVDMTDSPLHGAKIEMLNTMESVINPSETNNKVFNDTIRNITGKFFTAYGSVSGVFTSNNQGLGLQLSGSSNIYGNIIFDASRVVPVGDRNQTFAIGATYIMRIK